VSYFTTSLLREKITLLDGALSSSPEGAFEQSIIRANRMVLEFRNGAEAETVVVRAHTVHVTLMLCSVLMESFYKGGLFLSREAEHDWHATWKKAVSDHELDFNPGLWAAVYVNGVPMFRTEGESAHYIDLVERYEKSVAESVLSTMTGRKGETSRRVGEALLMDHSVQVAAFLQDAPESTTCAIIHRLEGKYEFFNFTIVAAEAPARIVSSLAVAASILEILNLDLFIKGISRKSPFSAEEQKRLQLAKNRAAVLKQEVSRFESEKEVSYNPARPF
jgi:hypothetical protein